MIKTTFSWYCSLCGYSKSFNPQKESPPIDCPACHNGQRTSYYIRQKLVSDSSKAGEAEK